MTRHNSASSRNISILSKYPQSTCSYSAPCFLLFAVTPEKYSLIARAVVLFNFPPAALKGKYASQSTCPRAASSLTPQEGFTDLKSL